VEKSTRNTDESGGSDSTTTVYDKTDKRGILSPVVVAMLGRFRTSVGGRGGGAVRLVRG
jgi:hypothetical protein